MTTTTTTASPLPDVTPGDLTNVRTRLLAASMRELLDELIRRGWSIDELRSKLGLSAPEE